jgi:hypothetical protein
VLPPHPAASPAKDSAAAATGVRNRGLCDMD